MIVALQFDTLVNSDLSWLGGSVFFVIIYLRIHTGETLTVFMHELVE